MKLILNKTALYTTAFFKKFSISNKYCSFENIFIMASTKI